MNHAHTPLHHHGPSGGHAHGDGADHHAEILDLDAEVLGEHLASVVAWLPLHEPPHHVVDLGSGTGTGTFALLDRFPGAHVLAVDASAEHLRRLASRATTRGVHDRVRTVQADLDETAWPDLGAPDLVWASASLHHLGRPDRALRAVHDALAPGGLFAVVELAGPPRFLPDDAPVGRPGLEARVHAVADRLQAEHMPHRGADWGPMLTAAGFTVEGERTIAVTVDGARSEAVGRYAVGVLGRLRDGVAELLPPDDRTALDRLLDPADPDHLLRRSDLALRTERSVWAARRD